jgi:hypothetical protein
MQSEMRRPAHPEIDRFADTLDKRLRLEARAHRRSIPPPFVMDFFRRLKALAKPLAQSGAMALTALVVIVAISATPAARNGDLVTPRSTPLAAPSPVELIESNFSYLDYLPASDLLGPDTLAVREPDNSDIPPIEAE